MFAHNYHIHFIGICGVAMSALAIAFHKKGYKVTGSDKGFYPPVSTHLKETGIAYYPGWHVDKMTKNGNPDLVIVGNVAGSDNPEFAYVQEHNIPYLSYPEALAKFFVKENSIVVAGTYGKTSTSALLSWTLTQLQLNPSYMFGGILQTDFDAAKLTGTVWSVMEGDEYKSARWDNRPKFAHYKPTHLVLTALEWDHADMYKTEELYFEAFFTLIKQLPKDGMLLLSDDILNNHDLRVRIDNLVEQYITYGENADVDYRCIDIQGTKEYLRIHIETKGFKQPIQVPILGDYMAKNITACFALCHQLGYNPEDIAKALETFPGIKRRLEKRLDGDVTIIDDIAHSPAKAYYALQTLKQVYSGKVIAVYEPNTGNRQVESIPSYDNAFKHADEVIIPRLTKIKKDPQATHPPMEAQVLVDVIAKTHPHVRSIEDDEALVDYLVSQASNGDVIAFLGSHGFRGMIEEAIRKISNTQ